MTPLTREDTRERIIHVLAQHAPLPAKTVHAHLEEQGAEITYQGVHKALGQLESRGVVWRRGRDYRLRPEWIEKLKSFANGLKPRRR